MAEEEIITTEEAEVVEEETEETEETVASKTEEETTKEETEEEKSTRKTGAEKRIAELTAKRRQAERDADYWRNEAMKRSGEPPKPGEITETFTRPKPIQKDFEDYDEYVENLADWKYEQKEAARQAAQVATSQKEKAAQFQKKLNEGFEKHEDFAEVALNRDLPITPNMVDALYDCEHAAEIAYHLGQNLTEARRIASLSPIAAAREIGKLEARFSGPPQKTTTRAPGPTKDITGKETSVKDFTKMTGDDATDFIEQRNRQELEELGA